MTNLFNSITHKWYQVKYEWYQSKNARHFFASLFLILSILSYLFFVLKYYSIFKASSHLYTLVSKHMSILHTHKALLNAINSTTFNLIGIGFQMIITICLTFLISMFLLNKLKPLNIFIALIIYQILSIITIYSIAIGFLSNLRNGIDVSSYLFLIYILPPLLILLFIIETLCKIRSISLKQQQFNQLNTQQNTIQKVLTLKLKSKLSYFYKHQNGFAWWLQNWIKHMQ